MSELQVFRLPVGIMHVTHPAGNKEVLLQHEEALAELEALESDGWSIDRALGVVPVEVVVDLSESDEDPPKLARVGTHQVALLLLRRD